MDEKIEGASGGDPNPQLNGRFIDNDEPPDYNDWRHCRNHSGGGGGGGGDDIANSKISVKSFLSAIAIVISVAFAWSDLRTSIAKVSDKVDNFVTKQAEMDKAFHAHEMEELPHGIRSWIQSMSQRQDRFDLDLKELKSFISATCGDPKRNRVLDLSEEKNIGAGGQKPPESPVEGPFAGEGLASIGAPQREAQGAPLKQWRALSQGSPPPKSGLPRHHNSQKGFHHG